MSFDEKPTRKDFSIFPPKRKIDRTERTKMRNRLALYSPCPCGSGKKYKFCCKAKS